MTSQSDAEKAIKDATVSSESASEGSDGSVSDTEDRSSNDTRSALGSTQADEVGPYQGKNLSSTSVAEDVATRNVSFGNFASQWLSRQKWPASTLSANKTVIDSSEPKPASKDDDLPKDLAGVEHSTGTESKVPGTSQGSKYSTTINLLPRILKTTKMIFTSGSYFFSYDINLTKRMEDLGPADQPFKHKDLDPTVSLRSMSAE